MTVIVKLTLSQLKAFKQILKCISMFYLLKYRGKWKNSAMQLSRSYRAQIRSGRALFALTSRSRRVHVAIKTPKSGECILGAHVALKLRSARANTALKWGNRALGVPCAHL